METTDEDEALRARRAHEWRGVVVSLALLGLFVLAACASYESRALSADRAAADFRARRLDAPELGEYVRERGGQNVWPPAEWDLDALSLAAFFYSPALDVARARWGVARSGVITAGGRPEPSLAASLGFNANTPAGEVRPWIPEVVLGLPIEVAGKRGIRVREAEELSNAARLELLSTAWQVRSRVRRALLDLYLARERDRLLERRQELATTIVAAREGQRGAGEISGVEVMPAQVARGEVVLARKGAERERVAARAELAAALGVPMDALDGLAFSFAGFERVVAELPAAEIRRQALLGRSDVLAALAAYAASQAALQLEVRNQYPDLELGAGYQLDQTDSKWTVGLGLTLPVFQRHRGPIAEAEARREEAAARFLAVQAQALGEIEAALATGRAALAEVQAADALRDDLAERVRTARAAHDAGETDGLALLEMRAASLEVELARLDALAGAQEALGRLGDAMQSPLDVEPWVAAAPRREAQDGGSSDD